MFTLDIPPGYTALIRGPASAECGGLCRVFGGLFQRFEVPPHKQYPVEGPAVLRIENGVVVLVKGSTTPQGLEHRDKRRRRPSRPNRRR